MDNLIFAALGVVGKLFGGLISAWLSDKQREKERYHELAMAKRAAEERPHDPGFDDAHDATRLTRRLVGLMVVFTASVIATLSAIYPSVSFDVPVGYAGGVLDWLLGTTETRTQTIAMGWFTLRYIELAFMACAFYFTPVSTQKS